MRPLASATLFRFTQPSSQTECANRETVPMFLERDYSSDLPQLNYLQDCHSTLIIGIKPCLLCDL